MSSPMQTAVKRNGENISHGPSNNNTCADYSDEIETVAFTRVEYTTVEENDAKLNETICGDHENLCDVLDLLNYGDFRVTPGED